MTPEILTTILEMGNVHMARETAMRMENNALLETAARTTGEQVALVLRFVDDPYAIKGFVRREDISMDVREIARRYEKGLMSQPRCVEVSPLKEGGNKLVSALGMDDSFIFGWGNIDDHKFHTSIYTALQSQNVPVPQDVLARSGCSLMLRRSGYRASVYLSGASTDYGPIGIRVLQHFQDALGIAIAEKLGVEGVDISIAK